jgi:acyl-CoA reductase-like NAD-dependent aldehyde dehydrogenase
MAAQITPLLTPDKAATMAAVVANTPLADIADVVTAARRAFETGRTKDAAWRIQQLKAIKRLCEEVRGA